MSTTYLDMMKLTRCEVELHAELAAAVTHPLADYAPGSPRLEALYASLEQAKQTWPLRGHEEANV
jgi:hypothetical protein